MKNTAAEGAEKALEFIVREDGALLATVKAQVKSIPSGKLKSCLEHRMISVDGCVTSRFDYPVRSGQTVRVRLKGSGTAGSPLEIIYEDEALLAVNKPAGLLSVASDAEKEKTAYRLLKDSGIEPIFTVHRLDRDTSGVLLFAKSAELRDRLQESWNGSVRREYLAICEGSFEEKRGRRESLLRETDSHLVYSASYGDGKPAITNYEVIGESAGYSMLRVNIETGRKNQIRVHMKELGHPVAGDKKYGANTNPLKRLALHASLLEITHPVTGQRLVLKAPKDKSFRLPKENG